MLSSGKNKLSPFHGLNVGKQTREITYASQEFKTYTFRANSTHVRQGW